jgi:hypothetical protein
MLRQVSLPSHAKLRVVSSALDKNIINVDSPVTRLYKTREFHRPLRPRPVVCRTTQSSCVFCFLSSSLHIVRLSVMSRFTLTATDFGIRSTHWRRQRQVSVQQQDFFLGRHRERPFMRSNGRHRSVQPVNTYPEPETEKERSPVDFPQVKAPTLSNRMASGVGALTMTHTVFVVY